jgi:hypothetical protein
MRTALGLLRAPAVGRRRQAFRVRTLPIRSPEHRLPATRYDRYCKGRCTKIRPTYLEGDTKVATVSIRDLFPNLALPSTAQDNRCARTFRHETRSLQVRLFQVDIPAVATHIRRTDECGTLLRNLVHLQNFPLDKVVNDASNELDDFALAEAGEGRTGAPEEKVSTEDGILVAEGGRRGRYPSTQVGAVDHVVMQQRRDMDHLDDLGEPRLRGQSGGVVGDRRAFRGRLSRWWCRVVFRWSRGDEGEDRGKGGGMVRHVGVPVVQHVRARQRTVELLCTTTRVLAFSSPFFQIPVASEAIGCAGK